MSPRFECYMVRIGAGTHPKFTRLTDAEFRAHIVGVLAIAALSPVRGHLLVGKLAAGAKDIATMAGVSTRAARSAMTKLEAVGVLERDEERGCLRVHDWDEINPPSPVDPTSAERQRRYRHRNAVTLRNGKSNGDDRNENRYVTENVTDPPPHPPPEGGKEEAKASSRRRTDDSDEKATDADRQNCRLLLELATRRNPKFKAKAPAKWLTDMRLLRERDGNSAQEIEQEIRWLFTDPSEEAQFWADVIQSPANLRDKFPRIWAKMHAGRRAPTSVENSDDVVERMGSR